jgi:hypothetical protein
MTSRGGGPRFEIYKCKTAEDATEILECHLSDLENDGFLTRKLAKPVGRHIYLADYLPWQTEDKSWIHPVLQLIRDKLALTLILAKSSDETLFGIVVGAPMFKPFGHSWSRVSIGDLCPEAVTSLDIKSSHLYQDYHQLLPKIHVPSPRYSLDSPNIPYELVLLGTREGVTLEGKSLGRRLVDSIVQEAMREGFDTMIGEVSGSTSAGSIRLMKKVYLKWGWDPLYLWDSVKEERIRGFAGEYLIVGLKLGSVALRDVVTPGRQGERDGMADEESRGREGLEGEKKQRGLTARKEVSGLGLDSRVRSDERPFPPEE